MITHVHRPLRVVLYEGEGAIQLAAEARACQVCAAHLPLGPKPVFLVGAGARLMIVGQAPGRRVHDPKHPSADAALREECPGRRKLGGVLAREKGLPPRSASSATGSSRSASR